jgi:hypothetical protein
LQAPQNAIYIYINMEVAPKPPKHSIHSFHLQQYRAVCIQPKHKRLKHAIIIADVKSNRCSNKEILQAHVYQNKLKQTECFVVFVVLFAGINNSS